MKKGVLVFIVLWLIVGHLLLPPKASAAGVKFTSVSSQLAITLALDEDGAIWAWGYNQYGQFGNGTSLNDYSAPARIDVTDGGGAPVAFKQVQPGFFSSIALDTDGGIWMAGEDRQGSLGNGVALDSYSWEKLVVTDGGVPVTFAEVAAIRDTSYALDDTGRLWGWGRVFGGQPDQVPTLVPITDGGGNPVALKSISGSNSMLIGIDSNDHQWQIQLVGLNLVAFMLDDGGVAPQFKAISAGAGFGDGGHLAAALENDGDIWVWGANNYGQLGDGGVGPTVWEPKKLTIMDGGSAVKFAQISSGNHFMLALDTIGNLWVWGRNDQGQLGDGTKTSKTAPHKITIMDGGTPVQLASVTAGYERSFAIDADGRIWSWGEGQTVAAKLAFSSVVALSASKSSSTYLEEITLTAAVTGALDTPTGSVAFREGATVLGTVPLAGGIAELDISTLSAGPHSIEAYYSGEENYAESVSTALVHTVVMPAAPVITLTPSLTSDTFGPVTVSASVQIDGAGNGLSVLKWLAGNRAASDFASAGTDITVAQSLAAASNGTYTVYAKDAAGNEAVKTISISNILTVGDPAALLAAIADAQQALSDHPAGTDVGQVPAGARSTLSAAIGAAQAVAADAPNRTQAQLNAAQATLETAITTFSGAVIGAGDPAALVAAIADAQQALADHPAGTDVGQAPASARNTLSTAIGAAQAVAADAPNRTQAQLDAAKTTLEAAVDAFSGAVIGAGDPAALAAAIADAQQALSDHPAGTDVGQAPAGARSTLSAAIGAAQAVADDAANQTQAQLDAAQATLESAVDAFNGAVIGAGNATALNAAIADAQQALSDHPAGTEVGQAPAGARSTLSAAIGAAQAVAADAANRTQAQLNAAQATLEAAITTFSGAVIGAGDPAALEAAIADAQQALDDHPAGTDVGQAPAGARSTLSAAIGAAQGVADDAANRTQAQLDTARTTLESAVGTFNGAVIGAGDATALNAAIADAQQALSDHPAGTDVGQAPAGARSTLSAAIGAAQGVADDAANRTQVQLNAAQATLETAITTFSGAVIGAGDPAALVAAIADAQQALADHPAGTDVGQAPASARNTLSTAIGAEQAVAADAANRTQAQLDAAQATLESAVDAFNGAVIGAGNATALNAAIADAQQALSDHPAGTDVGQAPASARNTLSTAIGAAQAVAADAANRTQAQLDAAQATLESAVDAFNGAVIGAGNATALNAAIADAQQALSDHPGGTDVGQAPASARNTLSTAIGAAQAVAADTANRTQAQLDAAQATLESAVDAFNGAVIGAGNATALNAAIADAQQALSDHPAGTDVGQAPTSARNTLSAAIAAAQAVADDAANRTQAQLDAAQATLESAVDAFNGAVIGAGNATALNAAIADAQQALSDHPAGTDVGQAPTSARNTLSAAIADAQAVADDAANYTQVQLDAARATLEAAIATFRAVVVGIVLTPPNAGLYGTGDTLAFTLTYRDEVIVTGKPRIAVTLDGGSEPLVVYAAYTGDSGTPVTSLTFAYEVPAGLADTDGIGLASSVDLSEGAAIEPASGVGTALLAYALPDTSAVRVVSIPPALALSADSTPGSTAEVTVAAAVYGEASAGNALAELRWLAGSKTAADFSGGDVGADILSARAFTVGANGIYTVYARDAAGNEAVQAVTVSAIVAPSGPEPDPIEPEDPLRKYIVRWTADKATRDTKWKQEELAAGAIVLDGRALFANSANAWTLTLPRATVSLLDPGGVLQVRTGLADYELPVAMLSDLSDRPFDELRVRLSHPSDSEQSGLEHAAAQLGAALYGQQLKLEVILVAGGVERPLSPYGYYITVTVQRPAPAVQGTLSGVLYVEGQQTLAPVPAISVDTAVQWKTQTGGIYALLAYDKQFADVQGSWAEEAVRTLASMLVINGVDDDSFAPRAAVTRAELTAMIVRALGLQGTAGTLPAFGDVDSGSWYAGAVTAAVQAGIVQGDANGRFRPDAPISRQEAAVMLMRAMTTAGHSPAAGSPTALAGFADAGQVSAWAREAMTAAVHSGLIQGDPAGRLRPQQQITRAETAAMLLRTLRAVGFLYA
ncbi:S-layer homology domain-containing protein [Cohnella sp. GCM10012308]|uniref:S-layer homology domain-containing protein n=1 Tax=Cohnella sp. GCM10012308 TaxID=3317329 RepID=UPI00361FF8E9